MRVISFLALAAFLLFVSRVTSITYDLSRGQESVAESVIKALNQTINPCENFYQYACGGWLKDAVIPDDESRYTRSFSNIEKHNSEVIASIMENITDPTIKKFHDSCMDLAKIEARGIRPIVGYVDGINDYIKESRLLETTMVTVGYLNKFQISNFFSLYKETDPGEPTKYLAQLNQGGLKIPRSLYSDPTNEVFLKYKVHVQNMFRILGLNPTYAELAVNVEVALAKIFQSDEELDDPFVIYNKISYEQLLQKYPNLQFDKFFAGLEGSLKNVNIVSVKYFSQLNYLITQLKRDDIVAYLQWSTLHSLAPYLNQEIRDEYWRFFGKVLRGEESQQPRLRQCISSADESIGFLVGKYFVEKSFPQAAKDLNIQMIRQVENAFEGILQRLTWMDAETKGAALLKLKQVVDRVGYPDVWPSYSSIDITDDYFANKLAVRLYETGKMISAFDAPIDRNAWEMTPSTVNAYYDPTSNTINFPAGILYNPYFSLDFPTEMNYGGVGLIMGHELSHGFDNHGRLYDGKGKLQNWWSKESGKLFEERSNCLVEQYNKFCPLEGHCINGKLTLGENIADNAGLKEAFIALQATIGDEEGNKPSIVPFLTRYQLFFTAFAQGWCAKTRPAEVIRRLETDVHSPPEYRVMGSIANHPEFGRVFNCPAGSPMNPVDKCEIF